MKLLILTIFPVVLLSTSCKKDDDDKTSVSNSGTLVYEKDLAVSGLPCNLGGLSMANSSHIYIMDNCSRIIRFSNDFKAIDWVGYNEMKAFGIHSLNSPNTAIDGYLDLLAVNNTQVCIRKTDVSGEKIFFLFDLNTGESDTISFEFDTDEFFIMLENGKFISVDNNEVSMLRRFNEDGTFDINYDHSTFISFPHSFVAGDADNNLWLLDKIQDISYNPPVLIKFDAYGQKAAEYKTHLRQQYFPSFAISDENEIYVEDQYQGNSEIYVYNTQGEKIRSYRTTTGKRNWLNLVVSNKNLSYNDQSIYEIWSFNEK